MIIVDSMGGAWGNKLSVFSRQYPLKWNNVSKNNENRYGLIIVIYAIIDISLFGWFILSTGFPANIKF